MQLSYSRLIFYVALISITSSISSEAVDRKKQLPIASSTTSSDSAIDQTASSAQEGVILLEQIMEKMRNLPQIAISKAQTIALTPEPSAGFGRYTASAPAMSVRAKKPTTPRMHFPPHLNI